MADRRGSANGLLLVNDTGPPELPAAAATPPTRSRAPLPGPKPQGNELYLNVASSNFNSFNHLREFEFLILLHSIPP